MEPLSPLHAMLAKMGRERHAHRLNRVVNHPDVLPFVRGLAEPPLDLTPAVVDPNNVLLMGQHGGILFEKHQDGLYEAHTQILPEGRGEWAVMLARSVAHWMFCHTEAVELMTKCPKGNYAARALTKAVGGRYEFTNPQGWVMEGKLVSADIFAMRIQDWMRDAPGLEERGRWFFDTVLRESARLHGGDMVFDRGASAERYTGAAVEMLLGGQPEKAMIFYNRWAALAGRGPMEVYSIRPLAIKFEGAIVVVRGTGEIYLAVPAANAPVHAMAR